MEEARGKRSRGSERGGYRKAVVIIVLRSDCSSTCELSVRISAAHRTMERGNISRRYIPRRTLTAGALAWPREGKTVKRYTALKSTFSLLKFYRPPTKSGDSLIPRPAIVVFMMGIPVTAKCSAMQRGRIIRRTAFCPSIAMTFTIVKSRTSPLAIIKPPTVLEFRMVVWYAMQCNATQRNATQRNATHESRAEDSTSSTPLNAVMERTRARAVTREFVFVMRRRFKNDLHS